MLDRKYVVPVPLEHTEHTLENLLSNLQAAPDATLGSILCAREYQPGCLDVFTRAVMKLKKIKPTTEELIFECFLRMSDFERRFKRMLGEHREKQCILGDEWSDGQADQPIGEDNAIVQMAARRVGTGDLGDARISILAYLIMAVYGKECVRYAGPHEIYYVINYISRSARGLPVRDEMLCWAENAQPMAGKMLYLECSDFFPNEIRYVRDLDLIEEIVIRRKSHLILHMRFELFYKRLKEDLERQCGQAVCAERQPPSAKTQVKNRLKNLLVRSFDHRDRRYSELILEYLQDEEITKYFIKETGCPVAIFYRICHKIDGPYADALVNNLVYFEKISDSDLLELTRSSFLCFVARGLKSFKIIVGELIKRGLPICVGRLFDGGRYVECKNGGRPSKKHAGSSGGRVTIHKSLSQTSLREEAHSDIHKINYLLNNNIRVDSRIFMNSLDGEDQRTTIGVFFKLADPKIIPAMYRFSRDLFVEELAKQSAYSIFYIECLNYLIKKNIDISNFHIKNDFTAYGLALKRKIRGFRFRGQEADGPQGAPDGGAPSSDAKHVAFGPSACILSLRSPYFQKKYEPRLCSVYEQLEDGLFFNNSLLELRNDDHRFTLCGYFVVESSESENILLKFNGAAKLFIKRGAVYFQECGLDAEKILSIKSRARSNTAENPHSPASGEEGMAAQSPVLQTHDPCQAADVPQNLYLNLKCIFNLRTVCFTINGLEYRCAMKSIGCISVDAGFKGVLANFIYFQSNTAFKYRECENDMDYYRAVVAPLQKLLRHRQRAGVLVNSPRPFMLNGKVDVKMKNILDYRQINEVNGEADA